MADEVEKIQLKDNKMLEDKFNSIKEILDSILVDEDIELAFCLFTIKNNPASIHVEKGHFYDITRTLADVVRKNHERMRGEAGL